MKHLQKSVQHNGLDLAVKKFKKLITIHYKLLCEKGYLVHKQSLIRRKNELLEDYNERIRIHPTKGQKSIVGG